MRQKDHLGPERRKYIRLDSVFPVEFRLIPCDGNGFLSDWLQGFTNNIGKGGICLEVNNFSPHLAQLLAGQQAGLCLNIEIPLGKGRVSCQGRVAWVKAISGEQNRYLVGLHYANIDPLQNQRMMRYARIKQLSLPLVFALIILLGLGMGIGSYLNMKLTQGNKALVEQLVKIMQETSIAKQKIKVISKEREDLRLEIQALETRLKTMEESAVAVDKLSREKNALQEKLIALQHKENMITEDLLRLGKKKADLEKANLEKMYQWLTVHQNPRTGLVMSFEGDSSVANWAFLYDQALVAQAYVYCGDYLRARKILDFFLRKAKRNNGNFFNAYYVNDGSPAEYIVHSGPNLWLGIAILQYTQKTQDRGYLKLAEEIALNAIRIQNQDKDGGIRGGPQVNWYSTEHNLDAYAFF